MPSHQRPKYDWPIRLSCIIMGKDEPVSKVPGFEAIVGERGPNGKVKHWRCCIDGLFAN